MLFFERPLALLFVIMLLVSPLSACAATTPPEREQINTISSYLDGSVVYGSDATRAAALRTFQGGKLKTSAGNLPPFNTVGLPNANDAHIIPDNQLFLVGDVRGNENVELSAVQTLFVREHNRIADLIAQQNSKLSDEQIYQRTRAIVTAELQVITYKEFLPALLGPGAINQYTGYKPNVNPGIANEFSTGAYRIGHTLVNDDVEFLDNNGNPIRPQIPLSQAFFDPTTLEQNGPDPILKYLSTDNAQEVDTKLVDGLRNFLFGPPGAGGMDLASLNIQRGRDHGLADYNTVRKAYGLQPVKTWSDITSDAALQHALQTLYGNVNNIDLWVGGLAEDHVPGSSMGPLFRAIIADQFTRLRDGDRFWYQRVFSGAALQTLENTKLSDVIKRNTSLTNIQDNVFFYDPSAATTSPCKCPKPPKLGWLQQFGAFNGDPIGTPSIDGSNNNPFHADWGKAGTPLLRTAPAAYGDGTSSPAGANRPNPRTISNVLSAQTGEIPNARHMSDWVYAWGQFIDHDLDLTTQGSESFDIPIPTGDPQFDPFNTGTQVIPFDRSNYDMTHSTWTVHIDKPHHHTFPSFE